MFESQELDRNIIGHQHIKIFKISFFKIMFYLACVKFNYESNLIYLTPELCDNYRQILLFLLLLGNNL